MLRPPGAARRRRALSTLLLLIAISPPGAAAAPAPAPGVPTAAAPPPAALLPGSASSARPSALADAIELDTEITLEWAFGLRGSAQKLEVEILPELEIDLPYDLQLTAIARFRADAYDRAWRGAELSATVSPPSRPHFLGDRSEVELRELYLQGQLGPATWTLGKQQIVWGQADGLKVLDVVNPQSFREFILEEFERSRIPLWTINIEIPWRDFTAQLLLIPEPSYHDLPPPGSLFAFRSPRLAPAVPHLSAARALSVRDPKRPRRWFRDGDAGLRLSAFLGGWDLALHYLYHYEDFPVPSRRLHRRGGIPTWVVTPEYRRTHLIGGSASNAFGDFTVRGEAGYTTTRSYPSSGPAAADGTVRGGELSSVLGLDWYGLDETVVSLQLFHSVFLGADRPSTRPRHGGFATLLLQRDFWHDALRCQASAIYNLRDRDSLLRWEVRYELRTGVELRLGGAWFQGRRVGFLGQFDHRDRVRLGLRFGF